MGQKVLTRQEVLKRFKLDENKLQLLSEECSAAGNNVFTEDDLEEIKAFRRDFPYTAEEIVKKTKTSLDQVDKFRKADLLEGTHFFSQNDLELFNSYQKLKRLGYSEEDSFRVLREVGIPREENLFEDPDYIQLKELSEKTGVSERTIKFYEKENLIPKPRIYKNKRFYETSIEETLIIIRDMQNIGYKLSTLAEILQELGNGKNREEVLSNVKEELQEKQKIIKNTLKKLEAL